MTQNQRDPTSMDFKTKHERRVRFADSVGLELASIFLFDLINLATIHRKVIRHSKSITQKPHNYHEYNSQQQNNNLANNNHHHHHSSIISSSTSLPYSQQQHHHQHQKPFTPIGLPQTCYSSNGITSNTTVTTSPPSQTSSSSSSSSPAGPHAAPALFNCEFIQPISLLSFKERVKLNRVHLETCQINSTAGHVSVTCSIRVLNCSYDKSVIVRYTTDDWRTHTDSLASYIPGSCDGWSDKFTSSFTLTNQVRSFQRGQRIIFAIRYVYDGARAHWDNNGGLNYAIKKVSVL